MKTSAARSSRSRHVTIALVAVLGILASLGSALFVCSWEHRVAEIDFQSRAKSYLEVINADLEDASTLLYTLGAFVETSDHMARGQKFERFSEVLHDRVVGLRDTGWAPRVSRAARATFERAARGAGIAPDFAIRERDKSGQLVIAGDRAVYHPILFVEARGTRRHVLGFDVSSEPIRAAAIARTLRTGQPSATPPVKLLTARGQTGGVMAFMAVGRSRKPGDGDRPIGVVLGVFEIIPMLENITAKRMRVQDLDLYLFDPASKGDHRFIYDRRSAPAESRQLPSEQALLNMMHWQGSVSMIDQRWGAIVTPRDALYGRYWSWRALATLLVGFMLTATIIAYLVSSLSRALQLESLTAKLRENAQVITHAAYHDALTDLPNRLLFQHRIDEAVESLQHSTPFTLLYLDLDRFKAVNDTLGHPVGDRLLCAVAERVKDCVRDVDTIARLGGDEFAIILADTVSDAEVGEIARRLTIDVGRPYLIEGNSVVIGVSIGIATARNVKTAETLRKEADEALYAAKAAGRGTFRFFEAPSPRSVL